MLERCPVPRGGAVLEAGCGSGRLLLLVSALAGAGEAIGVDPEPAMLARAAGLAIDGRRGGAERLPVASRSVDLAYLHLAHHLLADPDAGCRELTRVLRPGGHAAIWTLTPEHVRTFHLNPYFPSLAGVDLARFAPPEAIARSLIRAGLEPVLEQEVLVRRRTSRARLAAAARAMYISTLALVPAAEFEAGVERLSREAAADPAGPVSYEQRWCLVWGRLPRLRAIAGDEPSRLGSERRGGRRRKPHPPSPLPEGGRPTPRPPIRV